jgi:putative hydrolase of the HAD superfamily
MVLVTYKSVIFDLFGTLVYPFNSARFDEITRQMAATVGVDYQTFHGFWAVDTWWKRATGYFPTIEATVDFICKANDVIPSQQQLGEAAQMRYAFTKGALRPRHDAVATLQAIKNEGLLLGLISDCTVEVPEIWPETPFAPLIDVPIFSCAAGVTKPDPRIYRMACERLACAPDECVYVADGFSQELQGATEVGMRAMLLAPPGEAAAYDAGWEGHTWQGERVPGLWEVALAILPTGGRCDRGNCMIEADPTAG